MLQLGRRGRLSRLFRASIELVMHPGSWPFDVVRGRGDWSAAMIFMTLGTLITYMLQQVLSRLILGQSLVLSWGMTLVVPLTTALVWTVSWALTALLLARELALGTSARDELACALAIGWVPVIFLVNIVGTLIDNLQSTLSLNAFGLSAVALVLGLMLVSQKAVRALFRAPFEESFRPVALALLFNAFVQHIIWYFLFKFYAG